MLDYTNSPRSGFDIAERYTGDNGAPAVLRRAWFADFARAESFMRAVTSNRHLYRIIDCDTGTICPWRGITGQGENAISLEQWLSLSIAELRALYPI